MTHRVRQQILRRLAHGDIRGSRTSIIRQLKLNDCNAAQLQEAIDQLVTKKRIYRKLSKRFPQQTTLSLRK